jgi:hypothetical protein
VSQVPPRRRPAPRRPWPDGPALAYVALVDSFSELDPAFEAA